MPQTLSIEGNTYEFVGGQKSGAAVYRGKKEFLRVGPPDAIKRDLDFHRRMEAAKYPVATLVREGEYGSHYYFIERALGGISFRNYFSKDFEKNREVDARHFSYLSSIVEVLLSAQIHSITGAWDEKSLAEAIRLDELSDELPKARSALRKHFYEICERLHNFPAVITHGDCNPSNIYKQGIIDLEDSFIGPIGFDIASVIETQEWFPREGDYEFIAKFVFFENQKKTYINRFDRAFQKHGLPSFKDHYDDFAFCRGVWLCAGMGEWPKTRDWRFQKLLAMLPS